MTARNAVLAIAIVVATLGGLRGVAHAYPQYQLSKDQTCTSCHLSPAGGGLLNENGLGVAESTSSYGTAPEFFYNKVHTPSWLELGGDLRGAAGYLRAPAQDAVGFPMQAEVYAHAVWKSFSLQVTGGVRDPQHGNEAATLFWSREHYITWQSNPGGSYGVYVRVGRFMPVFGLRFAEHPDYTRQFGGTQLYGETYGIALEVVKASWEAHLTGFIKDPIQDTTEHSNGATFYGEDRLTEKFSLGVESRYAISDDDRKLHVGVTAKWYLPNPDLLIQAEVQGINQKVLAGGKADQVVGYLMATYFLPRSVMLDLGYGHYDEDINVSGLRHDAFDVNVHWFATSHIELVWLNRVELIDGPTGAYSLLMAHYRL